MNSSAKPISPRFNSLPWRPPYLTPEQIDEAIRELKEVVKAQQSQIDELIKLVKPKDS